MTYALSVFCCFSKVLLTFVPFSSLKILKNLSDKEGLRRYLNLLLVAFSLPL